jgi:hypothetical protein
MCCMSFITTISFVLPLPDYASCLWLPELLEVNLCILHALVFAPRRGT